MDYIITCGSGFIILKESGYNTRLLKNKKERETGIEPATPSLARRCSTTEPLAHARYIIYCISLFVKHFILFFYYYFQNLVIYDSYMHVVENAVSLEYNKF